MSINTRKAMFLITIIIFVGFVTFFIVYKGTGLSNDDRKMINIVKEIEVNNQNLRAEEITYEKYNENFNKSKKYLSSNFRSENNFFTKEQYDSMNFSEFNERAGIKEVMLEVSEVYGFEDFEYKFVFTRAVASDYMKEGNKLYITKMYIFKKEDSQWRVVEVDFDSYNTGSLKPRINFEGMKIKAHVPRLEKFVDEPVEYIEKIKIK